ncbi:MAG: carboxypeptidase regulatory-like domain-containing protein [Planctomycetia bacterium]|nr:carboxypeptidase regulatory-like domain-containing protein [Planctomycetia bacterium]
MPPEPRFDDRPAWPPLVGPYRVEVVGSIPVEGATVTVRRRDGTIVATQTTDATGTVVFDPPPAPEDVIVAVRSDGWSAIALVEATNPRRLVVAPPLRLEGTVVERWIEAQRVTQDGVVDGRPMSRSVPHARVRLNAILWGAECVFETVADGDGRFGFFGVPRAISVASGEAEYRAATEDGRLHGSATPQTDQPVEIPMARSVPVRGLVVDADGRAVPGAVVSVEATGVLGAARRIGDFSVTDRAGRFDVALPPAVGSIVVHATPPLDPRSGRGRAAWADRFRRTGRSAPFTITKDTPSVDVGRVALGRAGAVLVRVRDGAGATVPDVAVTLERGRVVVPAGDGAAYGGRAGPGTFVAGGLEGGAWTVRVRGRNVAPRTAPVEVVEGADVAVDVVVVPGRRAKGIVLGADGQPLAGAPIEVLGPAEPPATGFVVVRSATSGDDGTFDLSLLPPGPLRLRVVGAGHGTAGDGVELGDDADDLRVATTRLGRARLTLVTADGRPLPATATVTYGDPSRPDHTTTIDVRIAGGVLVLEGAAAQAGEVAVDVEGYAPFSRRLAVAPGDDVDLGRVVLTTGHRVVGRVTDGRGAAVAHARVVAAGGRLETTTDGDGRYAFDGVPDGVVGVSVVAEGFEEASEKVAVRDGEARLDVVLARAALVEGTVVGKDGAAAGGERLEFVRLDGEDGAGRGDVVALRTDDDGTFGVALPPGRYRVQAREADRTADTLGEVDAERGVTRTLRLTLPR